MVVVRPDPVVITDERVKLLFFDLLSTCAHSSFDFDDMLRLWFNQDQHQLAAFLAWIDEHGLEIRKRGNGRPHRIDQGTAGTG